MRRMIHDVALGFHELHQLLLCLKSQHLRLLERIELLAAHEDELLELVVAVES